MSATTEKKVVSVAPFGIEADEPRNGDILLKTIENCRLRSRIKHNVMVFDKDLDTGEQIQRPAMARLIDGMPPNVPGMQLHVNPATGTWRVVDPLYDDEDTCSKIQRAMERALGTRSRTKLRGMKSKSGKLGADMVKTLVREMVQLVENGDAIVVQGVKPTMADVGKLPGDFASVDSVRFQYHSPRKEKDHEEWVERLNQLR